MRCLLLSLCFVVSLMTTASAEDSFAGLVIDAQSDVCVTEAEAVEQADSRLRHTLEQELARRTWLPHAVLSQSLPRLIFAAQAQRTQRTESVLRPYGTLYRRHEQLRIPESSVQNWLSEIEAAEHTRSRQQWLIAGSVALSWLIVLRLFVAFDRRTRGYQRAWIATCSVTGGSLLTGGLCCWL